MIKNIFLGTMTFGFGAIAGYFVAKKNLEKQFRLDVDDIQKFYKEKLDEIGVMEEGFEPPEDDDDDDDDEDDDMSEEEHQQSDIINTYRGGKRRYIIDYTKPSLEDMKQNLNKEGVSIVVGSDGDENLGTVDYEDEEDPEDEEDEEELDKIAEDYAIQRSKSIKNGEPYLIKPEEYHEGIDGYDRQALYYYSKDRVLCEDDDSLVDDEEECVGFNYEDELDMQTTCWVRNDTLKVLYEIHRIDDEYKKAVIGISETPREREFRVQGRRKKALDERQ